ncbi:MAG TPA: metal-dependent hydrolase [Leptospiraceae bacterium]|nr:metal-dependent hydrolase [Leptospiraceae bacterium]
MALFITHGFFASLLSFLWRDKKTKFTVFILIFVASILPDMDFIFDDRGSGMFNHRGITHSIFFAAITGAFFSALFLSVVKSFGQTLLLMLIFFLASISHIGLDLLTDATYGVCVFCPFDEERYMSPITLFTSYTTGVSHKGFRKGLNSAWGAVIPEMLWVWIPTIATFVFSYYLSNKGTTAKNVTTYKPIQIKPKETAKPKYPTQKKR